MKLGLATTLSVAGVLTAGAAALVVNSSVLNATSDVAVGLPATSNSDELQPTGDASGASLTNVGGAQSGSAGANSFDAKVISSNAGVTTYAVGDAGTVVVDISSGELVVRDVVPSSGWESMQVVPQRDGSYKIHFTKGKAKKELRLSLVNGSVVAVVTDESGQSTPPAFNPNDPNTTVDTLPSFLGDDDDDEYEDEDEDDEYDDEDEDDEDEDDEEREDDD